MLLYPLLPLFVTFGGYHREISQKVAPVRPRNAFELFWRAWVLYFLPIPIRADRVTESPRFLDLANNFNGMVFSGFYGCHYILSFSNFLSSFSWTVLCSSSCLSQGV